MQFLKRLKPMTLPQQNSTANTIYVDSDTEEVKVGTGASGSTERVLASLVSGGLTLTGQLKVNHNGTAAAPAIVIGTGDGDNDGFYLLTANGIGISTNGTARAVFEANSFKMPSAGVIGWTATAEPNAAADTILQRAGSNLLELATGDSFIITSGGLGVGVANTTAGSIRTSSTINIADSTELYWNSMSVLKSNSNGTLNITNNAGTAGIGLSFTTDAQLDIQNRAQNAGATLTALRYGFSVGAASIRTGAGSPEGVVAAAVGSIYLRTDGSSDTSMYVKSTGTTTSAGWEAVQTT